VVDNPSADKFGPPPEQAARERELERLAGRARASGRLGTVALAVAIIALKTFSHSTRGWVAALAGVLVVVGYGLQYVLSRQRRDAEDGGPDPYSPSTHVTR
jgi:hypothetical protein